MHHNQQRTVQKPISIDTHNWRALNLLQHTSYSTSTFFLLWKIKNMVKNRLTKIEFMVSAVLKLSLQTVLHETSLCLSSITKRVRVQDPNTRWKWLQFNTSIRRGPQNWYPILFPELLTYVFSNNNIACGPQNWECTCSPELPSVCSAHNCHRMWVQILPTHVLPRTAMACGTQNCHTCGPQNCHTCGPQNCHDMCSK